MTYLPNSRLQEMYRDSCARLKQNLPKALHKAEERFNQHLKAELDKRAQALRDFIEKL